MRNFTRIFLLLLVSLLSLTQVDAQRRYLDEVFDEVQVSNITPVASNYTILPWLFARLNMMAGNTQRQPLVIRTLSPKGDTATNRPLVIYIHTGNFFPFPQNGSCGGTMGDSTNIEVATRLAKMGYVVAIVNYRQGWNPFDPQELVRRFFLINAAYRGVQDMNTYLRFFKGSTLQNNPYGIDADKITLWGQGTGGYLSLASSYLKSYPEIFATEDPNKFKIPTANGLIPMVLEGYNGNIEGTTGPHIVDATYNALTQLPIGDTIGISNYPGIPSKAALCVNMGGALGDSSWMSPNEVPLISFHVPSDAFAPYTTDILNVPTQIGPQPVVEVSGSYDLQARAERLGLNEIFKQIPAGKDPVGASKNSGLLGLCPFDGTPNNTSSPWEWTDTSNVQLLAMDCNADGIVGRTYIDTVMAYFAPRACVALNLNCFPSGTNDLTDLDVNLSMQPNPASTEVRFAVAPDAPIRSIRLYSIDGHLIKHYRSINDTNFIMDRNNIENGVYIVRLAFDKGVLSKKLIFN